MQIPQRIRRDERRPEDHAGAVPATSIQSGSTVTTPGSSSIWTIRPPARCSL